MSAQNVAGEMSVVTQEHPTRSFVWSVRRELWENKSIYIAPAAVAAVVLFGFVIGLLHGLGTHSVDLIKASVLAEGVFNLAESLVIVTSMVTGVFYCLDAMYGERRDRSIFFWKSLPVSDITTVLAKISIPLVVLPVVTFVVVVVTQAVMMLLGSLVLLIDGSNLTSLWMQLPLLEMWVVLAYCLIAVTLWHAPIYGYLLLVSAWANRATLLWAAIPLFSIAILERIVFHTSYFHRWIRYRVIGGVQMAFDTHGANHGAMLRLSQITPGRLLLSPGLWTGLVFVVAMVFAVVRMRRYREPI